MDFPASCGRWRCQLHPVQFPVPATVLSAPQAPLPVPWERWGNKLFASLRLSPPIVVQFYRHRRQDVTGLSPLLPAGLKKWRNDEELTCGRGRSQGRSHTCFSSAVNSLSWCVQWCCMMLHTNLQKVQLPPPITSTAADSQARLMLAVNCQADVNCTAVMQLKCWFQIKMTSVYSNLRVAWTFMCCSAPET